LAMQIMAKHEQHYYKQDPSRKFWTHSHFVLPHYIHNAMDTYVSLIGIQMPLGCGNQHQIVD
jgi:hypothetical protein